MNQHSTGTISILFFQNDSTELSVLFKYPSSLLYKLIASSRLNAEKTELRHLCVFEVFSLLINAILDILDPSYLITACQR